MAVRVRKHQTALPTDNLVDARSVTAATALIECFKAHMSRV
jgi:hypothetical protein